MKKSILMFALAALTTGAFAAPIQKKVSTVKKEKVTVSTKAKTGSKTEKPTSGKTVKITTKKTTVAVKK